MALGRVLTAEGLRQFLATLRVRGCREFRLWASSYGGWIGAGWHRAVGAHTLGWR